MMQRLQVEKLLAEHGLRESRITYILVETRRWGMCLCFSADMRKQITVRNPSGTVDGYEVEVKDHP